MGQPVTVVEKPSAREGFVRYETNRVLSGMDHERFTAPPDPLAVRPVDEVARRLFDTGRVAAVHVNGNVITVEVPSGNTVGLRDVIEELFTYYRPGVRVPTAADFADPEAEAEAAAG